MTDDIAPTLTIGRLARAAGVGIETVRYYQERSLLPVPARTAGFRHYPAALVERIRFVKRAQELGFSLEEIAGLLRLHDGTDRASIRRITAARLAQIEDKLRDLTRMRRTLRALLHDCEHAEHRTACPIIQTLADATRARRPASGRRSASARLKDSADKGSKSRPDR